ncbi:MAG: hypothetical protein KUG81_04805, partial [Gammaproteobacteria bacterium]|nr:hypothetical protein [Gammaproteobacteria bacterium]
KEAKARKKFMKTLMEHKRHQIRFKNDPKRDNRYTRTLQNKEYRDYLVNNKVVSTNAVVKQPTFQGNTTMFLKSGELKVKGKLSQHNINAAPKNSNKLRGTVEKLRALAPGLFKKPVTPKDDKSGYSSEAGNTFGRASSIKGEKMEQTPALVAASVRGTTIDSLIRDFFIKPISIEKFRKKGKKHLANNKKITEAELKKDPKSIEMPKVSIKESFYDDLHSILTGFAAFLDHENITIFPEAPYLSGKIGGKFIAGEMDLLGYNHKTKDWIIIDVKTATRDRQVDYAQGRKSLYKSKDYMQQNIYKELFDQKTNKKKKISQLFIFPLTSTTSQVSKESGLHRYSKITRGSEMYLLEVDTSLDIHGEVAAAIAAKSKKKGAGKAAPAKKSGIAVGKYMEAKNKSQGKTTKKNSRARPKRKAKAPLKGKAKPTPEINTASVHTEAKILKAINKAASNGKFSTIRVEGEDIFMTMDGRYIFFDEDNNYIEDPKVIQAAINIENKTRNKESKLYYTGIMELQAERAGFTSTEKGEIAVGLNELYDELAINAADDTQLEEMRQELEDEYYKSKDRKEWSRIDSKNISKQGKMNHKGRLKDTVEYLYSKDIKTKNILKICGI